MVKLLPLGLRFKNYKLKKRAYSMKKQSTAVRIGCIDKDCHL